MVVTEEKLREKIHPSAQTAAPFVAREEARAEVWVEGWTESDFEQIFQQHYARIVAILFRLVGDRAQAEELAGDVFWKIYHQPQLSVKMAEREHNIGGWLYRAATRVGIDALRASARRKRYEQAAGQAAFAAGTAEADPLTDVLRDEKRRRVQSVLAAMKPAQAQLLLLRQSGFSYQELGEILGVKTNSIGTLLARAEAEFEKRFCESGGDAK